MDTLELSYYYRIMLLNWGSNSYVEARYYYISLWKL